MGNGALYVPHFHPQLPFPAGGGARGEVQLRGCGRNVRSIIAHANPQATG